MRHCDEFPALEDQCCSFTTGFDRKAAGYSPDRVDALVWALTDLFPGITEARPPLAEVKLPRIPRGMWMT